MKCPNNGRKAGIPDEPARRAWADVVTNYLRTLPPTIAVGAIALGVAAVASYSVAEAWPLIAVVAMTYGFGAFLVRDERKHQDKAPPQDKPEHPAAMPKE